MNIGAANDEPASVTPLSRLMPRPEASPAAPGCSPSKPIVGALGAGHPERDDPADGKTLNSQAKERVQAIAAFITAETD
ncbi:hypothetical protein U5801_27990 [Lamprobacter modestohalophilus]|uniref:hypothetical protein n=1 Tax=Lamprobacter modestohalophilus TaxID=1064514 RepID=UPI002ADEEC34|nr:hypothetical protein [Lamprobacter modestohalophilus]MEA1053617.1 hypothetical protein [Lamprobacter modestohalophilus]